MSISTISATLNKTILYSHPVEDVKNLKELQEKLVVLKNQLNEHFKPERESQEDEKEFENDDNDSDDDEENSNEILLKKRKLAKSENSNLHRLDELSKEGIWILSSIFPSSLDFSINELSAYWQQEIAAQLHRSNREKRLLKLSLTKTVTQ
ncbi:hypothetical protein HDU92_008611 [Lobulomyces angularis]|nr:hypothetical protein HDU92_008611 [Lobulomyces angularis]